MREVLLCEDGRAHGRDSAQLEQEGGGRRREEAGRLLELVVGTQSCN